MTTSSFTGWPPPHHVLLPEFTYRVVLHPPCKFLRIKAVECGASVATIHNNDLVRIEVVEQGRGLRGDDNLRASDADLIRSASREMAYG